MNKREIEVQVYRAEKEKHCDQRRCTLQIAALYIFVNVACIDIYLRLTHRSSIDFNTTPDN